MDINLIEQFKNREIKAKNIFYIKTIEKRVAKEIVKEFHYLGTKDFMYTVSYGLFDKDTDELLGCAVFGTVGGISTLKSWFGETNENSDNYLELTRLVMNPLLNGTNATSFLLGNAIKNIKKTMKNIRAIISLAESTRHVGSIYQVCNFRYFGMSDKKTDFYGADGSKNKRGSSRRDMQGVWIERPRKHRYCYILDNTLEVKYKEEPYPKKDDKLYITCCHGTKIVHDNRFDKYYTCPICCGELKEIKNDVKKYIAYTDGSYCKRKDGNYGVGWAFIVLDEYNSVIHEEYGAYNEYIESRNVGGEIYAVVRLLQYCEEIGVEELEIRYDYEGIEMWATSKWKCKKELTQRYREFVLGSPIKITFTHVEGHSGEYGNEYVDTLAKKGVDMDE